MKKLALIIFLFTISVFDANSQTKAEIRRETRKKEKEKKKQADAVTKAFYKSGATPPNAQPGKCYAKCLIPDTTKKATHWSAWEEVLCSADITPRLVSDLVNALKNKGYNVDTNAQVMTKEIKTELSKYQHASNLPQGNLNIKTLKSLGIRY